MEFDASQPDDMVELLARCIAEFPLTEKTVLEFTGIHGV